MMADIRFNEEGERDMAARARRRLALSYNLLRTSSRLMAETSDFINQTGYPRHSTDVAVGTGSDGPSAPGDCLRRTTIR